MNHGTVTRRDGIRMLAGGALAGAVCAIPAPADAATLLAVSSRTTESFLDSLGIVAHLSDREYPKGEVVLAKLRELGIRHVRTNNFVVAGDPGYTKAIKSSLLLGQNGIRLQFTALRPMMSAPTQADIEAAINLRLDYIVTNGLTAYTEAVETFNEYDKVYPQVLDWPGALKASMIYLASQRGRLAPETLILGPALVGWDLPNTAPLMRTDGSGIPMSSYFDAGNLHSYYIGAKPETAFKASTPQTVPSQFNTSPGKIDKASNFRQRARSYGYNLSKDLPIILSETGYNNDPNGLYTGRIDEASSGIYLPRAYLEAFRIGILRTFMYELYDEPSAMPQYQRFFGCYRPDGTPKPQAVAVSRLTTLLGGGDPAVTPVGLTFGISDPAKLGVRSVLLQKRADEWWLAIWRPQSVWNYTAYTPIPRTPAAATLSFATPHRVEVHPDLALATDPTVTTAPVTQLTLTLGPAVTLVKITP
jgi:hypothetical protein